MFIETTHSKDIQVNSAIVEEVLVCHRPLLCATRCRFGYQTGTDKCPTCSCLEPV